MLASETRQAVTAFRQVRRFCNSLRWLPANPSAQRPRLCGGVLLGKQREPPAHPASLAGRLMVMNLVWPFHRSPAQVRR